MDVDIIVTTDRDRRTLDWLISQVGVDAVREACHRLAGQRKPYVSNVAKVLGLTPPDTLKRPTRDEVRAHLATIKESLSKRTRF